jgi:hypothetical protein
MRERTVGSDPTPSANTPSQDILFRRSADGRNGAEFGILGDFSEPPVRVERPVSGQFGPLSGQFL